MFLARCRQRLAAIVAGVRHILSNCLWARPAAAHITGMGTDLLRRRAQLLAENALLRHQVVILRRSVKRPAVTATDRALLVLLAGRVRAWRHALLIIRMRQEWDDGRPQEVPRAARTGPFPAIRRRPVRS